MLVHPHYIMLIVFVLFHQELQKFRFLFCKFMVNFSVTIYFDCNIVACLVIEATHHLCKAALSKYFEDFESIKYLVTSFHNKVTFFVIAFAFSLRFTSNCSFYNITRIVDHLFTFKALIIVLKLSFFEVSKNMRIVLNKLLLLHGPPFVLSFWNAIFGCNRGPTLRFFAINY